MQNILPGLFVLLMLAPGVSLSQELEPLVDMNVDRLSPDSRDRLSNFKQDVNDYLTRTRFIDEVIVNDVKNKPYRIRCSFFINFIAVTGIDRYEAEVVVTAQRYVYRTSNFSPLLRIKDDSWEFDYIKGQSFYHDDLKFNNLTSFLDYYAYLIIGYDDDSWELELGTKRFQKAQDVVNLAIASGSSKGWIDLTSSLKATRSVLIQELLNSKYDDFRKGFWLLHFAGIDSIQYDKRQALEKVAQAVELIGKTKKSEIRSFTIKAFFDAKNQEIAQLLVDYYDKTIYRRLMEIDPDHLSIYEEYSRK